VNIDEMLALARTGHTIFGGVLSKGYSVSIFGRTDAQHYRVEGAKNSADQPGACSYQGGRLPDSHQSEDRLGLCSSL